MELLAMHHGSVFCMLDSEIFNLSIKLQSSGGEKVEPNKKVGISEK
jgi:hypothetical protein